MVETKDIEALNLELDNRLDDLFGETDILLPDAGQENPKEEYPLAELKNTILSIDWEITDEVLDKLLQQIQDLLTTYEDDKIVKTFLQILNSLGNYIRTHRGKAPPKTFRILNSVFSSLDKVVLSEDMTESAKKKLLRTEMKSYKELRDLTAKMPKTTAKEKTKAKTAAADTGEKERVIRLEESAKRRAEKKKKADLKAKQDTVTLEVDAKVEEPLLVEDDPELELSLQEAEEVKAPETRPKVESETRAKAEPETRAKAEPEARPEAEPEARSEAEPEVRLEVEPEVRSKAEPADRSKTELDPHPKVSSESSAATLAEAVDELKRYIHIEIQALKKEIRLLRKNK